MNQYLKALIVALAWGAIATFGMLLLISEQYSYDAATGESNIIRGLDALKSLIDSFGWAGFRKMFAGYFAIVATFIFVGCLVYGKWLNR